MGLHPMLGELQPNPLFRNEVNYFWDTFILQIYMFNIKINDFRGDLIVASPKTKTPTTTFPHDCIDHLR